ncbi:hypothetical protein IQ265_25560 [Nodosilinea sp. LEGE 06152]|uniref:hypothetical protein n=1 Tax=Nodosilinea sp. LEGE 06152 TaxID=2777966 RepID=UPI00187E8742|nr:hypothetical protein [Nodosilinea sp. LEGE 06152]MBE9160165.1 hypothetical protein [Nodosilinea sp. LEGE 06152]
MNSSDISFVAKVVALSGVLSAAVKYGVPVLLANSQAGQNSPTLGLVIALLLAPSALMGSLFWLRRSSNS